MSDNPTVILISLIVGMLFGVAFIRSIEQHSNFFYELDKLFDEILDFILRKK